MELTQIPKIELHLHLDGAVPPETMWRMAQEKGLAQPADTLEDFRTWLVRTADCRDVNTYLARFELPLQLMQGLAHATAQPVWQQLGASSLRVMAESAPQGFSPDWVAYGSREGRQGFHPDPEGKGQGAYNAIRVYLWAGTLHAQAAGRGELLQALAPMARFVRERGYPPESIDPLTGQANGTGPSGFSAALLPFLQACGDDEALRVQQLRLVARPPRPDAYYEQCLTLFGQGWMEGAYRFDADGRLMPSWKAQP